MNSKPVFFLGANSEVDFVSYFRQLQEQDSSMQLLILKGGPGSGKSTLMRRVLREAEEKGHVLEVIPCASDPLSLDAFIDYTAGFSMMDGTAPHTEDPSLPGARHHILYTGDLWDCEKLYQNKDAIEKLNREVSDSHKGAGAYIRAASALLKENGRYAEKFLVREKAASFSEKVINLIKGGKSGKITKRLLSAVSVGEIKVFKETAAHFADKVFIIDDRFGAASDFIMKAVSFSASLKGENFIYCPCSIMPDKCDHLIFPDSRVALVTKNSFLDFEGGLEVSDFYSPFCDEDMIKRESKARELLSDACELVKKAKSVHDDLEALYKDAMDFSKSDALFQNTIEQFYYQKH